MNLRPTKFSEVIGNEANNKLLLAIAKNNGPSTILMAGDYGCGKTTSARLFSRACSCKNLTNDICGCCETCLMPIENNPYYSEYDTSIIGNAESITDLYEDLQFVPKGNKRVVVLDEFHLATRKAQSELLKLFEDAPKNIYYILCTTDKNKILPTIISRSLVLNFTTKSKEDVITNLKSIAEKQNIELSDNVAEIIALRSKGHMRDAHKLFEKYVLIGEKDFINLEDSCYTYLAKYFVNVLWLIKNKKESAENINKHKEVMLEIINKVMQTPVSLVKDDYQMFFLDLAKRIFTEKESSNTLIEYIAKNYDKRLLINLYKIALDDFTMNSFENDITFQTAILSIYQRLLIGV